MRLLSNATANAEGNWWGDPSGPAHATRNPGGLGNQVVVKLTASTDETATVTLQGPCGLVGTVRVAVSPSPAPALSVLGLLAATLALTAVAGASMRRAARRRM